MKNLTSAIIVEVGINIRQGDTVRIKETFEKEVVFQRVYLSDTETISHNATGSGATSRTYPHTKLITRGIDKVRHDKEVARETHRLPDMQLETDSVLYVLRYSIRALNQLVSRKFIGFTTSIDSLSALVGKFCKIVSLKLDSVYLIISAKFLYLLLTFFLRHLILAVLIACKLLEKVLFRIFLPPFLFRTEFLRYWEERHDRVALDVIGLYFVKNLKRIAQGFWNIRENLIHLCLSLEPLLLRISHTVGIVQILTR